MIPLVEGGFCTYALENAPKGNQKEGDDGRHHRSQALYDWNACPTNRFKQFDIGVNTGIELALERPRKDEWKGERQCDFHF